MPETKNCIHQDRSDNACYGELIEYKSVSYCPLHYPESDRTLDFHGAYLAKLNNKDFNFKWVVFPLPIIFDQPFTFSAPADFSNAVFEKTVAFVDTVFSQPVTFHSTTFQGYALFQRVKFKDKVDFIQSDFEQPANFVESQFALVVSFLAAVFQNSVTFTHATFEREAIFSARFKDSVEFSSKQPANAFHLNSKVSFDWSRMDQPELTSFHNVTLRPYWFINSSPQKFRFINVEWNNDIQQEAIMARQFYDKSTLRLLGVVYRDLAINYEEAHWYREASDFRYASMDAIRLNKRGGRAFWTLHWWYWIASGYGERIMRAFVFLSAMWLIFAFIYTLAGFDPDRQTEVGGDQTTVSTAVPPKPLSLPKALVYSSGALFLQKPEPKPVTTFARAMVVAESVLGPVQAALLVLAVRRKFIR